MKFKKGARREVSWTIANIFLCLVLLPAAAVESAAQQGYISVSEAGKFEVPESKLRCTKVATPNYPPGTPFDRRQPAVVEIRAVILRSGQPLPLRRIDGPAELEAEAENAVRQWRFSPYVRNSIPIEVVTTLRVEFVPNKPGGTLIYPTTNGRLDKE